MPYQPYHASLSGSYRASRASLHNGWYQLPDSPSPRPRPSSFLSELQRKEREMEILRKINWENVEDGLSKLNPIPARTEWSNPCCDRLFRDKTRWRHQIGKIRPGIRIVLYLVPFIYIPFECFFLFQPGPIIYRNNLPALIQGACLAFTVSQLFLLQRGATTHLKRRWQGTLLRFWWVAVTICTIICAVCYGIARRWDCMGVSVLSWLTCWLAWRRLYELEKELEHNLRLREMRKSQPTSPMSWKETIDSRASNLQWWSPTRRAMIYGKMPTSKKCPEDNVEELYQFDSSEDEVPWWKSAKKFFMFWTWVSRPLRVLFLVVVIFNAIGSIKLAQQSMMKYPGSRMEIDVPGYGSATVNFYCTMNSVQNAGNKSTVWFEGSSTQGIMEFLGVQHFLVDHDIPSCSYDPPSFGGSDVLRTKAKSYENWLPSLIKVMATSPSFQFKDYSADQNITYVGWGTEGTKLAVQHTLKDKNMWMMVALDPLPAGSEWLFEQQRQNWTEVQREEHRSSTLADRVDRMRLALSFGVGWGLISKFTDFITPIPKDYYPDTDGNKWQSQKLHDATLAHEYWSLVAASHTDSTDQYLNTTQIPDDTLVRSIFSEQLSEDIKDREAWRIMKRDVMKSLKGKQNPTPLYCWDCERNFVVSRANWTASAIAGLINGQN